MKLVIAFLGCLLVAVSASPACDECKKGVLALGTYLTTDAEIEATIDAIQTSVCDDKMNGKCSTQAEKYWPGIAKAIFEYKLLPTIICSMGGECKRSQTNTGIDCDKCKYLLGKLKGVLSEVEFMETVRNGLAKHLYCESKTFSGDKDDCKDFVMSHTFGIMALVGNVLSSESTRFCNELVQGGCS